MNMCSEAIKPCGKHTFEDIWASERFCYPFHSPIHQNGTNTLDFETMTGEESSQIDGYKNSHAHTLFGNSRQPSLDLPAMLSNSKSCHQEARIDSFQNGQCHYRKKSTDCNNNPGKVSELEAQVVNILSTKDHCSLVEIQKRLNAVTSPKVVECTMDNLVSKSLVRVVNLSPKAWALNRRHDSSEDRNGITNLLQNLGSFFTVETPFRNCFQKDDKCYHGKQDNPTLPAYFQKKIALSYEDPGQGNPDHTGDDFPKRFSPRVSSLSEEECDSGSRYGVLAMHQTKGIDYQKQPTIGGLRKTHRCHDGFDLVKNVEPGITHSSFPPENFRNSYIQLKRERTPLAICKPTRDPGVIGEGRTNQSHNRRSKSLEETWFGRKQLSPNEYDRQDEALRPRSRSFCTDSDVKQCSVCRISFTSQQQLEEHFQSTKHQNKMAKVTSDPYPKFCDYCKVGLNSKSQAQEHFASGRHEQTVAKSQKAPIQNHFPITTASENFKPLILTSSKPQDYQVELYIQAMATNSVCFLPTGAGNALISAMVVAHMLYLNPSRQVIFLVDRVLLVIQQSDYLKNELRNLQLPQSSKDDEQISRPRLSGQNTNRGLLRPIRIGAICGEMRKLEPGIPVFSHDILVVTADCYRNHINNGTLRFEDSALIVLDESHHCNKDHPYNVIIRDYFLPVYDRPKILGLTSSPAGEPTLDRTVKKMQRLLCNLGDASLLTVSNQTLELTGKISQSDIVCNRVEYSPSEKVLLGALMEYCTKCFNFAGRVSGLKEYKDVFQPSSGGVLSKDDIGPILEVIDKFSLHSKPRTKPFNSLLHFQAICEAICALQECGEMLAVDRMMELTNCACPYGFNWAIEQGLACESIKSYTEQFTAKACRTMGDIGSGFYALVELLAEIGSEEDEKFTSDSLIAVVLVKRNQTAIELANYLDYCHPRLKGFRTTTFGCEANTFYQGIHTMQSKALSNIHEGFHQIAVTTYKDEERLDLPACSLVIQLDPPNTASALGQIRSRCRDNRTKYIAMSRDGGFPKKIKDLLLRESNMMQASQIIAANSHSTNSDNTLEELLWMI